MGYWIWYLLIALLAWAFKLPWLALLALVVVVGRRWVPDPSAWMSDRQKVSELTERVASYPADVLARRDLARLCLARHRPARAARLLEEAIAKGLDEPETYYLLGLARLHAGAHEAALGPIVKSVTDNERLLLGDPYFAAAEALFALGRNAEAEDALERGLAVNGSRVDGHVQLGRARARRRDRDGARAAYRAAADTWRELPDFLRWKYVPSYLRARWELLAS